MYNTSVYVLKANTLSSFLSVSEDLVYIGIMSEMSIMYVQMFMLLLGFYWLQILRAYIQEHIGKFLEFIFRGNKTKQQQHQAPQVPKHEAVEN